MPYQSVNPPDNPAYKPEFFGPVALVFLAKDEEEAIAIANDSPYGLGGSIYTKDIEHGKRVARQQETDLRRQRVLSGRVGRRLTCLEFVERYDNRPLHALLHRLDLHFGPTGPQFAPHANIR